MRYIKFQEAFTASECKGWNNT